jgi:hypothetical protein
MIVILLLFEDLVKSWSLCLRRFLFNDFFKETFLVLVTRRSSSSLKVVSSEKIRGSRVVSIDRSRFKLFTMNI